MSERLLKWFLSLLVFSAIIAFLAVFGLPQVMRAYVSIGIGNCAKIPILCMEPQDTRMDFAVDKDYLQGLIPLKFPKTNIRVPKGFKVVQELISKPYFKKKKSRSQEAVIYLIHQPPGFFIQLFPQVKNFGVRTNAEFMRSLMHARASAIDNIDDAFFVILKSIFTPDLGDQKNLKMIQFKEGNRDYLINYNLAGQVYFFDCTILPEEGDFFKVYIKDINRTLDLNKVFAIISTISPD